jgi:hypothetical protein
MVSWKSHGKLLQARMLPVKRRVRPAAKQVSPMDGPAHAIECQGKTPPDGIAGEGLATSGRHEQLKDYFPNIILDVPTSLDYKSGIRSYPDVRAF